MACGQPAFLPDLRSLGPCRAISVTFLRRWPLAVDTAGAAQIMHDGRDGLQRLLRPDDRLEQLVIGFEAESFHAVPETNQQVCRRVYQCRQLGGLVGPDVCIPHTSEHVATSRRVNWFAGSPFSSSRLRLTVADVL
jgi:hypothetical protein